MGIRKLLFCSILAYSATVSAATSLPIVEILGHNYYVYTVKKGDSLFGISRDFGWDYATVQKLNPKAISPIPKGFKIYYPASEQTKPVVIQSPDSLEISPVTHVVKRGETVYGLSKLYKISVDKIYELNPGSKNGIKDGETLILQESGAHASEEETPLYYTIKRGDTLYSVAKSHETTVATLLKYNPGVSEHNFKAGAVIRLPGKGTGIKKITTTVEEEKLSSFSTYKVDKNDTWDTIAEKTGVDKEDIIGANKDAGSKPKNKSIVSIPQIDTVKIEKTVIEQDPRELTDEGISSIYEDVHGISDFGTDSEIKAAILLSEPSSRKDLEFSRGFMAGLDKIKDGNTRISFTVVDGTGSSTDVLTKLSDIDPDILFLTTEKGIPTYLSEFAEISQTPMVNTFDVRNELYTRNPYVIQLLTPSNYFNDEVAARLAKDYGDYTLVYAGPSDQNDQLASSLRDLWNKQNILTIIESGLSELPVRESSKYLIYGNPMKKDDVQDLLKKVNDLKEIQPLADIAVLGRPSWIVYEESLKDEFHKANVLIPSRFFADKDSRAYREFEMSYKSLFDREPAKAYPMYACVGYDAATYFIPGLAASSLDINAVARSQEGAQSEFELTRPSNWTGLMNPVVYIVRFTPFNSIEKIAVR